MQNSFAKKLFAVGSAAAIALSALAPFAAQAAVHAVGTNVSSPDGTVWMIMPDGTRRAYTSAGAFLSYGFNSWSQVVPASSEDLALTAGSFIPPQDGSIICSDRGSDKGTCYFVSGGMKYGFTSAAVFTGLGFSFANSMPGDVSWMNSGSSLINSATMAHLPGTLVNNNGTVQLVGGSGLLGIPDLATFNSWGYSFGKVVPANAADKAMTQTGVMTARTAGMLSPSWTTSPTPSTPAPTPGTVSVSLAANNAPAATVPLGSTNVPFVKFVVSNGGSSAATLTQVTAKRMGAGTATDFSNVYLYNGSMRLTSGRSVNSSTNEAVFSGLNVTVPAYGSVTLDVVADMTSTGSGHTGNVNQLSVTSAMFGSTQANGTATGNNMTLAGVTSGVITIAKTGSITNPKVGQTNVRVASFTLNASSAEDLTVKRVSLYQSGAVNRTNFSNFKLTQAGNQISSAAALDDKDHVNFDMNFALAKGDTKTFEVWADIAGTARVGSSETVKFYLEESTDIFALGNTYGFGASVTKTDYDGDSCTSSSGDCSYSYIEGGQLTITYNGPSSKDIAKNGKDVEVFNFTIAAQNTTEIRQMLIVFDKSAGGNVNFGDGTTANFTDVKIVDASTGAVVWGPQDLTATEASSATLTFPEDLIMSAGTSKTFKVTMDVANNSDIADGDKIRATLDIDGLTSSDVKNLDNNTFLTSSDIIPTSDVVGNDMTVRVNGLTVSAAATPTSKSFVKGTSNVDAAGFVFTASTAGKVKVTDLTLTGMIATSTSTTLADGQQALTASTYRNVSDDIVTVKLYDGTTQIGQTKSPAVTTGLVQFSGLNWEIPAGQSKTLVVKMDISNSATASDIIKWKIASSNVTSVDVDGNSVTVSGLPANGSTSTTSGTAITVSSAGTMTIASAGASQSDGTDARIVGAGLTGVTLGKVNFTASSEDLKLTKIRINVLSASAAGSASPADDITALWLYDGATVVAGPVSLQASGTSEAYVDFNALSSDFIVAKDATKALTIKADLNTISNGADSGDEFAVNVSSSNFEARGTSGSTLLTSFSGSYLGSYMVLRKSQPKVEVVSLGSNTLSNGTNTLFRFKVTAQNGDVALKHITFTSSTTTGVTLSAMAIREMGGSSISIQSSNLTYGSGSVQFDATFTSQEVITSGTSKTYEVTGTVAGADTGDSIATSIAATDTAAVTGYLTSLTAAQAVTDDDDALNVGNDSSAASAAYNFIWSDMSAIPHNDTQGTGGSHDWTNGRNVKTIPTDSQGLSLN